jgi:hypothetical protein
MGVSFQSKADGLRVTGPVRLRQLADQQNVAAGIVRAEFARGHVERVGDIEDNQLVAVRSRLLAKSAFITQALRNKA